MNHAEGSIGGANANTGEELAEVEEQLLAVVRDTAGLQSFSITIRKQKDGRFFLSQNADDAVTLGSGFSFEEAWIASGSFDKLFARSTQNASSSKPNQEIEAALRKWIAWQPDPKPSLDEARAYALRDWLTSHGLLPRSEQ